jgi:hypothetical protein
VYTIFPLFPYTVILRRGETAAAIAAGKREKRERESKERRRIVGTDEH